MAFSDFILTTAGEDLLEKVMAGSTKLTLTSFRIGSGALTVADIPSMTALKKETASFSFGSLAALGDDLGIHLTVDVDNKSATSTAYQWTESAIYATDPDKGSIVFAASYATDSGETIPVYDGKYPITITEDIVLIIGSASNISVTVDGSAYISRTTASGMIADAIKDKADTATTLSGYGITDAYTKTTADSTFAKKAVTLSGYGVTDAYTKTETDTLLKAKANTTTVVTYTLKSGSWANSQYSFESTYPSASYDVEVGINGDSATDAQYKAWAALKPMDSASNILKIKGKTPTIDIPVLLKVVDK